MGIGSRCDFVRSVNYDLAVSHTERTPVALLTERQTIIPHNHGGFGVKDVFGEEPKERHGVLQGKDADPKR